MRDQRGTVTGLARHWYCGTGQTGEAGTCRPPIGILGAVVTPGRDQQRGGMNFSSLTAAPPVIRAPSTSTPHPLGTWPNLVTLLRTVLAVVVGAAAIARADLGLLAAAYTIYWVGDVADGWLARRLDQETRAGAVFDIVGDRANTVLLCVGLLAARRPRTPRAGARHVGLLQRLLPRAGGADVP